MEIYSRAAASELSPLLSAVLLYFTYERRAGEWWLDIDCSASRWIDWFESLVRTWGHNKALTGLY